MTVRELPRSLKPAGKSKGNHDETGDLRSLNIQHGRPPCKEASIGVLFLAKWLPRGVGFRHGGGRIVNFKHSRKRRRK
jgi:hypothetical protein